MKIGRNPEMYECKKKSRKLLFTTIIGLAAFAHFLMFFGSSGAEAEVKTRVEHLDHRDDLNMNFIGGGAFREYISDNVEKNERWVRAMRKFGIFHDLMHELMSELAWHHVNELEGEDIVFDFGIRISGGGWTEYRKSVEENPDNVPETWRALVQQVEVMHDRVHHAMFKATVYDHVHYKRDVELSTDTYLRYESMSTEEVIPEAGEFQFKTATMDEFRERVWADDFENKHWRSSMQKMIVWREMLGDMLIEWSRYAQEEKPENCSPDAFEVNFSGEDWSRYAAGIEVCEDELWRNKVKVVDLMRKRIDQLMYKMLRHDDEFSL